MAEQRHADEGNHDPAGIPWKRRGILAAAGAVMAAIIAKQASQQVAATAGTGPDGNFVLGSNSTNNTANYATLRTELVSGLNFHGPVLLDCSASPFQSTGDANAIGVSGVSRGTATGIYGSDYVGSKPAGYPVGMNAGVYGYTYPQGHSGVRGDGGAFGIGVSGVSFNANAILGTTLGSPFNANAAVLGLGYTIGVEGNVPSGATAAGSAAVRGINQSTGANPIGVLGSSTSGYGVQGQSASTIGVFGATNGAGQIAGVYGVSNASYGVIGFTTAAGYSGLTAITGTAGVAALSATSTVSNAFAAYFTGSTVVQGDFVAFGGTKSAAVKDASGQHRLVYCVESPEAWFEDFGEANLVNGQAHIVLDPTFAEIARMDTYHVFLTEYGGTNHIYVASRTARGFVVASERAGASGAFSYRVVAKRQDIAGERLAKFNPPQIHRPDPEKLPRATPPGKA